MKKTNIAMRCNLGYDKCIRYINWLLILDLIKNEIDENGFTKISLTDRGMELYRIEFTK